MEFSMTIDGKAVPTLATFGVDNPATGEIFAEAPECSRDQLDLAMTSAARAFESWKSDLEFRRKVMYEAAAKMAAAAEKIAPVLTLEQGQPLNSAIAGIRSSAHEFIRYADLEIPRHIVQDDDEAFVEVLRRPIGVIAAITPWNSPIGMAMRKIAPALRAGCTVVVKPSPYTPLATLMMGEVLREVLPPGVLNVISGSDQLGAWMTEHPIPRGVSFTGSVQTGKRVNVAAAADLKRVTLELGGNDAVILLDDVDPEEAAKIIFPRALGNNGQFCMAPKRVFVPEAMVAPLAEALARQSRARRLGDGMLPETEQGPINNSMQFERVKELVADALTAGAHAVAGGAPLDGPGYFFPPTVLTGVAEGVRIVDEEQFGPALPIMSYRDVSDAIARANATTYGLGGSVWSNDLERASELVRQLDTGMAWANTHGTFGRDHPVGGVKWSGLGSDGDLWGVYSYTDMQTVYEARSGQSAYARTPR
jgi:acyl-CoA reductase-like NAD-dependent aldehyde dehydrogenase